MSNQELQCFLDVDIIPDYIDCIAQATGEPIFTAVYLGLSLIMIAGWSRLYGIGKGMMMGSFFSVLIGLALFVLETISVTILFMPILGFFVGLFITMQSN